MLEEIIKERKQKLEKWKAYFDPYPARVKRSFVISEVLKKFKELKKNKKNIYIVGRVIGVRDQGKIIFIDLRDESGNIQVIISKKDTKNFSLLKETLDRGDFIEAKGFAYLTKRGEKSIFAKNALIIVKTIQPLPNEWYGIEDPEIKIRQRYLDTILNPQVREIFVKKSIFWQTIRDFLRENGFLEVDNLVLENVPGGAEAEPFVTHMNALDEDFYLRISLELPLKKMLVGGFEKIFEIGRVFRNEGIDREHLQDYLQMEVYWAYTDYIQMMKLMQKMYRRVVKKVCGTLNVKWNNTTIYWGKEWKKIEYFDIFKKYTGLDLSKVTIEELKEKAKELEVVFDDKVGKGRLIDLIYKKIIRPKLIQPVFLINPPVEIEPLAKRIFNNPQKVERFQIVAMGTELGKGFSELNDPLDQRARFEEQMKLREKGDKEAQMMNEDFVKALEYGMPPASGFGMSERFFAFLMNLPVREIQFFPLLRKKEKSN